MQAVARLIASGMVKMLGIGQSAAKLLSAPRAYGEGSTTKWWWAGECDARRLKI